MVEPKPTAVVNRPKKPEMIAVVSESNRKLSVVDRDIVHAKGLLHRVAHVDITNSNGLILLHLRAPWKIQGDRWDLGVSEHLRHHESFRDAAGRGLVEEMGIVRMAFIGSYLGRADYGGGENVITKTFSQKNDNWVKLGKEVVEARFFSAGDLKLLLRTREDMFTLWAAANLRLRFDMPTQLRTVPSSNGQRSRSRG